MISHMITEVLWLNLAGWLGEGNKTIRQRLAALLCSSVLVVMMPACGLFTNGSISGKFYQLDGSPYEGEVSVFCQPVDESVIITHGDPAPPYLTIRSSNTFVINSLPSGKYYIWASSKADADLTIFSDGVRVANVMARETANESLVLVPGGSIRGGFLDSKGIPLPDAGGNDVVLLYNRQVTWTYSILVGNDGVFSMDNILPGEYQIYSNLIGPGLPDVRIESGKVSRYDFPGPRRY